jgi:hypothetical protein
MKSYPPRAIEIGKSTGADYSRVYFFFRLVVTPLLSEVVRSYPIWDLNSPIHLPLEGTGHI